MDPCPDYPHHHNSKEWIHKGRKSDCDVIRCMADQNRLPKEVVNPKPLITWTARCECGWTYTNSVKSDVDGQTRQHKDKHKREATA